MLRAPLLPASLALLLLLTACGGSKSIGPIDGARALQHVEQMVAFGPRPFGSDALAKTADYICAQLKGMGLDPKRHEVLHDKEQKLIRNLYVQIDGVDAEQGPILMFGAHYDTKLTDGHADGAHNFPFLGAIDGGGGPAVLLELARELKARPEKLPVNIWLYWIDAEESLDFQWNDQRALLGSKAFCKMLAETPTQSASTMRRLKAFVLLDLLGSKDHKFDRDGNSNSKLQDLFLTASAAAGCKERMYQHPTAEALAYYKQSGVKWGTKDDHEVFMGYGVPSVLLIDFAKRIPPHLQNLQAGQQPDPADGFDQWWHTPDDNLANMDAEALACAGNLVIATLPALVNYCIGRK